MVGVGVEQQGPQEEELQVALEEEPSSVGGKGVQAGVFCHDPAPSSAQEAQLAAAQLLCNLT